MANREMFKRIRDQIKADPRTFNMGSWETKLGAIAQDEGNWDYEYYNPNIDDYEEAPASECGTIRCIAGWAIHFEAVDRGLDMNRHLTVITRELGEILGIRQPYYETVAMEILDIDDERVFYASDEGGWEYVNQYAEGVLD